MAGITILWPLIDGRYEPVATTRTVSTNRGVFGPIAQRVAQPVDHGIQTVVEIDERATRPEPLAQLFTGDDVTGSLQQQREDLERLLLKPDADASLPQLAGLQIQLKTPNRTTAGGVEEGSAMDSLQKAPRKYRRILPQSNLT